jgi:hypothetical protein
MSDITNTIIKTGATVGLGLMLVTNTGCKIDVNLGNDTYNHKGNNLYNRNIAHKPGKGKVTPKKALVNQPSATQVGDTPQTTPAAQAPIVINNYIPVPVEREIIVPVREDPSLVLFLNMGGHRGRGYYGGYGRMDYGSGFRQMPHRGYMSRNFGRHR